MKINFVGINDQDIPKLEVIFKEEPSKFLIIHVGEKKEVFGTTLSFLDYNSNFRVGYFLVSSKIESCPENCICNIDGSRECTLEEECVSGTILCPDGTCKKECVSTSINECTFGCLYGESCLPIGTRVSGEFCSIERNLEKQLSESLSCENNFECGSNLCIDGQCIEKGAFSKMLDWFKRLFN